MSTIKSKLDIDVKIDPPIITKYLAGFVLLLTLAHFSLQLSRFYLGFGNNIFVKIFDLDVEKSLPSLFVLMEWVICLSLLGIITYVKRNQKAPYLYWFGMVIVFLFLTLDEFMTIHEILSWSVHRVLNTSGVLYFAWVIPYTFFILILGLIYLRFLVNLPVKFRNMILLAFLTFTSGAIGVELFEGQYVETYGKDHIYFIGFVTIEEFLEMSGLLIFINALLIYLADILRKVSIRL